VDTKRPSPRTNRTRRVPPQVTGYSGPEEFPSKASGLSIIFDDEAQAVLVPINGVPVPFHISSIKNVAKTELGTSGHVLRINFVTPGQGITMDRKYQYLRELSYKGDQNLATVHRNINEMKKQYVQTEKERKARNEIVPQEPIRINPNRGPRLQNLRIYPNLQARGRKTEGDLEAHINGFRFTVKKAPSPDLKHVDILYRNIKHAFFQPSNKASMLILVHFRLKNPIMIGKQSAKDIQFYIEHGEDGESLLENKRRNPHDRDELEEEERQKQHLAKLDGEFKRFCDKVQDLLPALDPEKPDADKIWEWDIPYNELEFQGNPKNSMVELYPTVNCIVSLAQKPVCIIELDEIDICCYERMRPGSNSNFDIAFVYKKFLDNGAKMPECWERLSTIDQRYYDTVKEVLQRSNIPQYKGAMQMNWNTVLKDYVKNFDDISADGGWKVILGEDDDSEEDEDGEESDDDFKGSGSDSDESSEEESDEDSDMSEYSEGSSEEEELSDEGMDSDEAEAWAEEEDRRKREEDKLKQSMDKGGSKRSRDDDDDRPRKKHSGSSSSKGHPPKKSGLGSKKR
jgi:nucleosome binding factor SPN SPT16 subunit